MFVSCALFARLHILVPGVGFLIIGGPDNNLALIVNVQYIKYGSGEEVEDICAGGSATRARIRVTLTTGAENVCTELPFCFFWRVSRD